MTVVFDKIKLQMTFLGYWRSYLAEFFGTFVFVFCTCGAVLVNSFYGEIGLIGIALVAGFAYVLAMYSTVHISGGHLNPAVTVALWLNGKIQGLEAISYIIFQILAGFASAGMLLLIFGKRAAALFLGGPVLAQGVSDQSAILLEMILAAFLVFVYFATIVDKRGPVSFGPLAVGLVVLVSTLIAGPITGASLNPARALGPLVIAKQYGSLAIFTVGPISGSLFSLIYNLLFLKKVKK